MSGAFSVGGLITGLDSNQLIQQLMQIERQPITRIQRRIAGLEAQRTAINSLRSQLQNLLGLAQRFQSSTNNIFSQYRASSSSEGVLTAQVTGSSPAEGAFALNVLQLASATVANSSAPLGAAIDANVALNSSGIGAAVTAGTFTINGVQFNVDPASNSLNAILAQINASAAGVTATYDSITDKVTFENTAGGDTSLINFGASGDTSNFLSAINILNATQLTGGGGSTVVTSTRNLGAIDPNRVLNTVSFAGGAVTAGNFYINGAAITVDPTTDTLSAVIARINSSDAGVTASYDSANDTIRLVSNTLGSRTIRFTAGTSNFLNVTNLTAATQTAGSDAQFAVDGGSVQTRNTNQITDVISGVTLTLLSAGSSTVTVSLDNDAIVEDVREFVDAFNATITLIREQIGQNGALENDGSIRSIEGFLRNTVFQAVTGLAGSHDNLLDIGFSTGATFDSSAIPQLSLDEEAFREALNSARENVAQLFSNTAANGIADLFEEYLAEVTGSTGFLNERVKTSGTIDQQVESGEQQIARLEQRLALRERRLRAQFARLEQLAAVFQAQGSALSGLSSLLTRTSNR